MITWLDTPFRGTNIEDGFEVMIHGFVTGEYEPFPTLFALCVKEEGTLALYPHSIIALDWRFTRKKGWHMLADVTEGD